MFLVTPAPILPMNLSLLCFAIALHPSASTELPQLWRWFPAPAVEYGSIVAGDLTGVGVEDVAYLAEGDLRIVRGAAWYQDTLGQVFEELVQHEQLEQEELSDLALLPGAGDGGSDALAVVSDQGLRVLRYAGEGSWDALVDESTGALEHVAAWNDGGSTTWIAAIAPGGWVHRFAYDADQGALEPVASPFSIGGGAVLDVLLFNRDLDDEPEVAIARDSGLPVHAWDGSHLGTVMVYPFGSGVLASVLQTADRTQERLALVTTELAGSPTTYWLRVLFDEGGELVLENPIDIGADQPLCLAAADWNADGEPDLLVSSSSLSARVFENLGGVFSAEQVEQLSLELPDGPSSAEIRALVLDDLDHDGDADAFLVSPELGGALLLRSEAIDSLAWAPTFALEKDPPSGDPVEGFHPFELEIVTGTTSAGVPAGATEVEFVVYHAPEEGVSSGDVADVASQATTSYPVPLSASLSVPTHPLDDSETWHHWVVEARYRRNVPGQPALAYPIRFGKLLIKAKWDDPSTPGAAGAPVPPGNPTLRGQLDQLDEIPPYVETPMNP